MTTLHRLAVLTLLTLLPAAAPWAQDAAPALAGSWVINENLSDNTDRQVEAAMRASGQQVQRRLFDLRKDRYRGGPAEHELYDRISYDRELHLRLDGDVYEFTYADDYLRPVYTDNRSRSVSLTGLDQVEDFSMAHWEDGKLLVEGRVRDGGFAQESYELTDNGTRLRAELLIQPQGFRAPIELVRVYDRAP